MMIWIFCFGSCIIIDGGRKASSLGCECDSNLGMTKEGFHYNEYWMPVRPQGYSSLCWLWGNTCCGQFDRCGWQLHVIRKYRQAVASDEWMNEWVLYIHCILKFYYNSIIRTRNLCVTCGWCTYHGHQQTLPMASVNANNRYDVEHWEIGEIQRVKCRATS